MKRKKGYLEKKLNLKLCGENTFEKDKKIRKRQQLQTQKVNGICLRRKRHIEWKINLLN